MRKRTATTRKSHGRQSKREERDKLHCREAESVKSSRQEAEQRPSDPSSKMPEPQTRHVRARACAEQFPREHKIRIAPLKIGNHALAFLFANVVARIIQGPTEIATKGIVELGLEPRNLDFFDANYHHEDISSDYPWPTPKSITEILRERTLSKLSGPSRQEKQREGDDGVKYARFSIATNVPNIYPIRSYSIRNNLLLDISGSICNVGYLPSLCEARDLLPGIEALREHAANIHNEIGRDTLWVHIRAGDILDGHNRLYKPLTHDCIHAAAATLNRDVVFIGQLEDSSYVSSLKQEFANARFFHTESAGLDFEIMRQSRYLLLSTSTFAWLAGWLSTEAQIIFVPRSGLYNPEEAPEINLIDCSDKRFHFIGS